MKESSLMRLSINGAEFYAYHGVKSEEQTLGGKYQVDLDLFYNATQAIVNDDVNDAVNYEEAMFCIQQVICEESYNLVETIANEILNLVIEKLPSVEKACVKVRKLNVPIRNVIKYIEAEQTIINKPNEH